MPEQKLYIGNLPYRAREWDIREYFRGYGPIHSVILIYDPESEKSLGYGFVELDDSAAEAALRNLNDTKFMGRNLKIRRANVQNCGGAYLQKNSADRRVSFCNTDPEKRNSADICFRINESAGKDTSIRDIGNRCFKCVLSLPCGAAGEYGNFKREDFNDLDINEKYYEIEREKRGPYQTYKFMGNHMEYSGPSNA